jgi:hypothetical protein
MTILEGVTYSPIFIVPVLLLLFLGLNLAARLWTAHRMKRTDQESDEVDRHIHEAAPYLIYEVETGSDRAWMEKDE